MGWPVGHSRSPSLHGHWFERYGIDGTYVPLPVRPEDVELAFRALPRLGFLGWNVTVPHKETACRLVDELDPMAARIGAVNTVLVQPDGRTRGLNSDGLGFLANLRQQAPDWRPEQGAVLVLGAGGAARAVAVALLEAGVPALRLANRTEARAAALAGELAAIGPVDVVAWADAGDALRDTALLVNCTSLGMTGQPPLEIALGRAAAIGRRRRSGLRAIGDRSAGRARVVAAVSRSRVWGCCCIRPRPASPTGAASCPRSTSGCGRRCWLPARRIVPAGR